MPLKVDGEPLHLGRGDRSELLEEVATVGEHLAQAGRHGLVVAEMRSARALICGEAGRLLDVRVGVRVRVRIRQSQG